MRFISKYILLLAVFPIIFSGCSSTGHKKSSKGNYNIEIVEAEGLAPIAPDLSLSRKNAVADAQKRAIESVVGVYVSADSLVSKAQIVEDNITSQTEGFIEDYKILNEKKDSDFYRVRIKAWVKREDLTKKIAEMDLNPKKYGNPTIALWINENIDSQPSQTNIVGIELSKLFLDAGYVVSDRNPQEFYKTSAQLLNDNPENLQKLNSDIIVIGEASSSFNTDKGLGGLVSYRANTSIKVLMTSTRDIITTSNDAASGIDINKQAAARKALANAGIKTGQELPNKVLSFLKDRAYPSLIIRNLQDLLQAKRIIRSIKTFPNTRDCWLKSFSAGTGIFSVDLKKGTFDEIGKMLELNSNFRFKVLKAGKYEMEVEIVSETK